ncbi:MAG TPA: hypothetical protein ENH12_06770 [Proteobacteria bacterium]|nr:hypothetical protein [Pseudomonadota bacterium]
MKKNIFIVVLLFIIFPPIVFSEPDNVSSAGAESAPAAYDRTTVQVRLNKATPAQIEEALILLNRNWGIFPSLQYLRFPLPGGDQELLFLRGRNDEVESARRIAEQLDGLYPAGEDSHPITPLPLTNLRADSMRDKILALSGESGLGITPEQLIIFPDKTGGSLFFRGTALAVSQVREIKKELDQSRHESLSDLISGFLRRFREDLSVHFLTVSTYAAAAILLLIIHFILINIPWVGKFYQRWFTLIWTRLINDVKGRGFAFEVIKSLAETAVDTVEQESIAARKNNKSTEAILTGSSKKARALAIARELLIYRGFDPDDPQIKRIVNDVIESAVFRLNNPGGDRTI